MGGRRGGHRCGLRTVKAHRSAQGGKGAPRRARVRPVTRWADHRNPRARRCAWPFDALGRPGVVLPAPGAASDVRTAPEALADAPGRIRRPIAGKGCGADRPRADLRANGTAPIIPGTRARKRRTRHGKRRHRERRRIGAARRRLKDFRRTAARHDKPARDYAPTLAAVIAYRC